MMPIASTEQQSPAHVVLPFIKSVRETFKSMIGLEVTVGKPVRKTENVRGVFVTGLIGFSGQLTGCVVIGFPRDLANVPVEKFVGAAVDDTAADFADAIGEITNIIIGGAKSGIGLAASITVPSVIIGTSYTIAGMSATPCFMIPCTCDAGSFSIELSIRQTVPSD